MADDFNPGDPSSDFAEARRAVLQMLDRAEQQVHEEARHILDRAEQQAQRIIQDAEAQAQDIIEASRRRTQSLEADLDRLLVQVEAVREALRSFASESPETAPHEGPEAGPSAPESPGTAYSYQPREWGYQQEATGQPSAPVWGEPPASEVAPAPTSAEAEPEPEESEPEAFGEARPSEQAPWGTSGPESPPHVPSWTSGASPTNPQDTLQALRSALEALNQASPRQDENPSEHTS